MNKQYLFKTLSLFSLTFLHAPNMALTTSNHCGDDLIIYLKKIAHDRQVETNRLFMKNNSLQRQAIKARAALYAHTHFASNETVTCSGPGCSKCLRLTNQQASISAQIRRNIKLMQKLNAEKGQISLDLAIAQNKSKLTNSNTTLFVDQAAQMLNISTIVNKYKVNLDAINVKNIGYTEMLFRISEVDTAINTLQLTIHAFTQQLSKTEANFCQQIMTSFEAERLANLCQLLDKQINGFKLQLNTLINKKINFETRISAELKTNILWWADEHNIANLEPETIPSNPHINNFQDKLTNLPCLKLIHLAIALDNICHNPQLTAQQKRVEFTIFFNKTYYS